MALDGVRMRRAGSDVFAFDTASRSHGAGRNDAQLWKLQAALWVGQVSASISALSRHGMMVFYVGVATSTWLRREILSTMMANAKHSLPMRAP